MEITAPMITLTASTFYSDYFSLPRNGSERNSESLLLFLFHGTEFRVVFSSAEEFGRKFWELASSLVPWNGIHSCFLFRWRVWKAFLRVCLYICSTERNSELFSLPRKGSERNSESFCSGEQPEFRRKLPFVPSIPSSAELFFCRKFPTLCSDGWRF